MWSHDEIMADRTFLQYYYTFDDSPVGIWPTGAASTPNFALDYSGKSGARNLNAQNLNYPPSTGVWYPLPSEPRLPLVQAVGSDHFVQFKYFQFQWTAWGAELGLAAQHSFPMEHIGNLSSVDPVETTGSTFTAWVYHVPYDPAAADIAPFSSPNDFRASLLSTWKRTFGVGNYGSQLGFTNSGQLFYDVGLDYASDWIWFGDVYPPYTWVNFTNILDRVSAVGAPLRLRRSIYINGVLAYRAEGRPRFEVHVSSIAGHGLTLGLGRSDDLRNSHGRGGVDRVAYWSYPKPTIRNRESWGIIAT